LENIWKSIWNPPNEGFFITKMGAFSGLKIYSCTVCYDVGSTYNY
jgi:hypothetical protein